MKFLKILENKKFRLFIRQSKESSSFFSYAIRRFR